MLQANLAQVTVRQNEDVRKISAAVAILAVPTDDRRHLRDELRAHAGAGWSFGYPLALALMATICIALYRYFRRVGWL